MPDQPPVAARPEIALPNGPPLATPTATTDAAASALTDDGAAPPSVHRYTQQLQLVMSWVVVVILTAFGAFALYKLSTFHQTPGDYWQTLVREQFPVLVGLPMAGLGALFVTLVLRISTGPLEFEVAGLKFKGGAAPIVFWVLCFLCIVVSINMLWQS